MGCNLKDLLVRKTIALEELHGKTLIVDGYNLLYQFLTTIRGPDGSPLTDQEGNVTSHLVGLFSRTTKLLAAGIKLAFVFDGKPPALKLHEQQRRRRLKEDAAEKYESAVNAEDLEGMKKYGGRTAYLTQEMVGEAKQLIRALGCPVIDALSEGEAQAAFMLDKENAYAVVSQDFDALLFGAGKVIRNLSIVGKRKKMGKLGFEIVQPEIIDLAENLNALSIDRSQLIAVAMLIGTDFNVGGIPGIGPKNAIKKVQEFKHDFKALFESVAWEKFFDVSWKEVLDVFEHMPHTDTYSFQWSPPNLEEIKILLVDQHNFSQDRVTSSLTKFKKETVSKVQKGLGEFF